MSMFDFVKRSNQLMFGAAKDSLKDYTKDISDLGTAATQVREKLSSGTRSARDTMTNFKSKGLVSGISNWFYGKEFELGDSDEILYDEDFDSGNPDLRAESEEAGPLTNESMRDLVRGQVSSMYKIGSKQTEAGIANTAEIVSTISKSSAEIIAAVNNVNSSLINISGKLDGLVELLKPPQNNQGGSGAAWFDSSGRFSIRSLMEGIKNPNNINGSVGMVGSIASMLADPNMRKMMLTPEFLMSEFVMNPLKNRNFDVLGGKNIDYYGKKFQETTHNMIEETIEALLEKTPLGDMMGKDKYRGNLGRSENQYTKDAAVFDKATRHTIISIIPEYLKKMTEAMTGQKWNVNEQGYLTTKSQANPYSQIGNVLNDASLAYDDYQNLQTIATNKGSNINQEDMNHAQTAWIWVVVHYVIYAGNRNNITAKTITDMLTSPQYSMYLDKAVQVFNVYSGGNSKKKARKILEDVFLMICSDRNSARALAAAGNKYMREIEDSANSISENNPFANQYADQSSLNWDVSIKNLKANSDKVKEASARRRYEEQLDYELQNDPKYKGGGVINEAKRKAEKEKRLQEYDKRNPSTDKEEEVTSKIGLGSGKNSFNNFVEEMNKYTKSIYDILNKGVISVRIVTGGNNNRNNQQNRKRSHRRRKKSNNKNGTGNGSDDGGGGDADTSEDVESEVVDNPSADDMVDDIANVVNGRQSPLPSSVQNVISDIRTNGLVNTIKGRLSDAGNKAKTTITNARATHKMDDISNKVNSKDSTVSDMDKQRVQMINTALQTAMQDGNGVEDKSKIRQMISTIDDTNLKQEMSKIADSVLTKEESDEKTDKPKSLVGRLLSGIGTKLKSAFSFVMKPISALLSGIGKGLKTYWDWTKKTWKSGIDQGKQGFGKIKGALFGGRSNSGGEQAQSSGGTGTAQMDDISTAKGSTDLGGNKGGSSQASGDGGKSGGGEGKGSKAKQLLSGGFDIASMIMKLVGPVIAGMAGVELLVKLVQGTLKKILEPINKLLKSLFKALSPILDTLAESLTPVIDVVVDVLTNVITPMAPVIQSIFETLTPILDIATVLLDSIMIPLQVTMDAIIVPALELATGCLKAIMGILQLGFGSLMTPVGAILLAVGKIVPGGRKLAKKGESIMESGMDMVTSGGSMVVEGVKEAGLAALKLTGPGVLVSSVKSVLKDDEEEEDDKSDTYQAKDVGSVAGGSAMEGIIGSGDVVNNYYYQNMYGSGNNTYNQNSYHNGMNMAQHGCGPIALADRANRSGGGINPYQLTQAMMANGNYSPNAGTSVAGMISTGRALGMNLVPGGVTSDSLRGASPNNPITVIGSGMGFGTRGGANHYVNVVGTDSAGGAYVSNPMTGRVGRVKANELIANSKLGLYGSGDDISYKEVFGDSVASAFGELTNIWSNISNIFNFKDGETRAEKTERLKNTEKEKAYISNVKARYSEEDWQNKYNELSQSMTQNDGETDEEYEHRINLEVAKALGGEYKSNMSDIGEKANAFAEQNASMIADIKLAGEEAEQKEKENGGGKSYGGAGGFYSSSGNVKLATDGYTPEFTDTDMTESVNGHFIHSPIHEFFAKMGGLDFAESNNNWYQYYSDAHNKEGEGSSGNWHQGIDINLIGGKQGKTPVYATTDGTLVIHQPEALADGGGNYVEWIDNDGMHHRIMHLDHFSEEMEAMKQGDPVVGGKTLLGYYGTTGASTGLHIHYDISPNGYGSSEWINPLTYFSFKPSATDGDSSYIAGDSLDEQMWQWLRFKGMKLPESSVAGIMGVWKAEGVQPKMIEGAYSEPETSLAEPIYDAIVGDPDNNEAGLQKLWDYTPDHAVRKNGGYLPNYYYDGHPWAGLGLAQWTAGRTYKLLKHAWDNGQRKWYELLPQLRFFEEELKTTHTKAGNELTNGEGHTPEEMAQMFWTDFEGFNWGSQADYDKRRNNARQVYDRFKGTEEINSNNFGTVNSQSDAYYAGYTDEKPGGSSSTPSGSSGSSDNGVIHIGNTTYRNIDEFNKAQYDAAYRSFYENNLKKKYDKATKRINGNATNYGGYPELLLKDYMKAVMTPSSSYLDPDGNGYIGAYIAHAGMDFFPDHRSINTYTGGDIDAYSDIKKNGMYAWDKNTFKKAVYSVISNDASLSKVKEYLDNLNSISLPGTQDGANASQSRTDHENMLYDYALDKLIGRAIPGYVPNKKKILVSQVDDLRNAFDDLSSTNPAPAAFQAYAETSGGYDLDLFKKYWNDNAAGNRVGMYQIPAIFKTSSSAAMRKIRGAYGSGDEIATNIVDIPEIDYSKFTDDDWNNTIWNTISSQASTQQYSTQTQDNDKNEQIDRILANEFKTSDKRTHELLEKIYKHLEKEKEERESGQKRNPNGPNSPSSQDMFENEIPNSVYRLARG